MPAEGGRAAVVLVVDVANVMGPGPTAGGATGPGGRPPAGGDRAAARGAGARRRTAALTVVRLSRCSRAGRARCRPGGRRGRPGHSRRRQAVVALAQDLVAAGELVLVVTADRGLRARLPARRARRRPALDPRAAGPAGAASEPEAVPPGAPRRPSAPSAAGRVVPVHRLPAGELVEHPDARLPEPLPLLPLPPNGRCASAPDVELFTLTMPAPMPCRNRNADVGFVV